MAGIRVGTLLTYVGTIFFIPNTNIKFVKIGNIITFTWLAPDSTIAITGGNIGTFSVAIPAKYRPTVSITMPVCFKTTTSALLLGAINIDKNTGTLTTNMPNVAASYKIAFTGSYCIGTVSGGASGQIDPPPDPQPDPQPDPLPDSQPHHYCLILLLLNQFRLLWPG